MINEIQQSAQVTQNRAAEKTGNSKENGDVFKNFLKEATAAAAGTSGTEPTATMRELSEISSIRPIDVDGMEPPLQKQTEALLSRLEHYSSQLENPGATLKEVSTLLDDILSNTQDLIQETENMSLESQTPADADGSLKDIASRLAITAQSEYIKFQRGDYL